MMNKKSAGFQIDGDLKENINFLNVEDAGLLFLIGSSFIAKNNILTINGNIPDTT